MEKKQNKFDEFVRRPSLKLYMLFVVALVLAGVFFKDYITKPHIHSAADLQTINGTLDDWYRMDKTNGEINFSFTLKEYKASFQVPGKFFGFAYLQKFQSEMKEGDPLMLRIPKYDMDRLNTEYETIYAIGVWDDKQEYVEKDKALERELSPGDLYMALGSLGAALLFGLIGWLMDRSRRARAAKYI